MKDFGRWFQEQSLPFTAEPELPGGFYDHGDGTVEVRCCACNRLFPISDYVDRKELMDCDPSDQYCGGSPGCTP